MSWKAREITIVASLAIHAAIAFAALHAAHEKKVRRATTVALADEKKPEKKPEPPKPPPPPPPKPKAAPPKVAPTPAPAPEAAPPPTAAPTAAPVATDIAMTNDVGMDMGTGQKQHEETGKPEAVKPKPAPASVKTPVKVDQTAPQTSDSGACTEPPGKPEPTLKTDIEYTEEARAAGVEGRLVLEVTVDADGNVTDVKVITGVDPALDASAIATVKTWRFKPAMACGKPVAGGTYRIARRFELGD
jgi:protein TonB